MKEQGLETGDVKISRKKPRYPVGLGLHKYLKVYQRDAKFPICYQDLVEFTETVPVLDKNWRKFCRPIK